MAFSALAVAALGSSFGAKNNSFTKKRKKAAPAQKKDFSTQSKPALGSKAPQRPGLLGSGTAPAAGLVALLTALFGGRK